MSSATATGVEEQVKESKKMLEDLKTRLKDELAARRRMYEYKIKWNSESGINPDIEEEHRTYIRQLCEDFYKRLKEDIKSAVAHRENSLQDRHGQPDHDVLRTAGDDSKSQFSRHSAPGFARSAGPERRSSTTDLAAEDLPPYVKMIVSTLPEDHYEAFPKLKARYENETSNFYDVPRLGHADVSGILEMWLKDAGRRLTPDQMATLLETCKNCPLPLFLKLSFDEACRWRSYWPPEETKLEAGVRESINVMFTRMEGLHGKTFVERALGYLTVSRGGLTETELEDVLSCDDEVLNSVYVYHTPPVRRLPPLLLVRLKDDLMEYMVDRGADGVQVFFWYHRQFLETARARYCDDKTSQLLHAGLADFFAGTWATVGDQRREKPYTVKGTEERADRIVTPQPLMFGNSFNLRKLNNLPHHAIKAKNTTMLHKECLLNYDFLRAKLEASAIRAVLDDYTKARKAFPKDEDVETVGEALQLSQVSLPPRPKATSVSDPWQNPPSCKGSYFDGCLYVINVEEGKRVQKIEDVRTHDVNICL
nr:hypothetical protein BaRGS_010607 [Batillaria attramentaria]